MNKINNIKFRISFFASLLFLFVFVFINEVDTKYLLANSLSAIEKNYETESSVVLANPFSDVDISARSAIVFFPKKEKILFGKNEKKQLPLASLTKLITALVALESIGEDEFIPFAGDLFLRDDLVSYILVVSSNDASDAIKDYLEKRGYNFNKKAKDIIKKIGLNQTYILNPSGLDVSDYQSGGYGSAYDIAKLIHYFYLNFPSVLEKTSSEKINIKGVSGLQIEGKNTNKITGKLAGFVGGKTGYTDLAGGNLAVLVEPGGFSPVVLVVLGSKDKKERFVDIEKLNKGLLKYISYIEY